MYRILCIGRIHLTNVATALRSMVSRLANSIKWPIQARRSGLHDSVLSISCRSRMLASTSISASSLYFALSDLCSSLERLPPIMFSYNPALNSRILSSLRSFSFNCSVNDAARSRPISSAFVFVKIASSDVGYA